ncbi:MAG: hypothetical protein PF636_09450 [Actinomycetota bacterium]|nr:hypothetical protein [Actinomycetota bacterium]
MGDTIGGTPLGLLFSEDAPNRTHPPPAVPEALTRRIQSLREGEDFSHWYMDKQTAFTESMNNSSLLPTLGRALGRAKKITRPSKWPRYTRYVWRSILRVVTRRAWLRQPNEDDSFFHPPVKDSVLTNQQVIQQLMYRSRYKRELKASYAEFIAPIEFNDLAYVYFPLHFQPERTTNPEGGILRDQFIAISTIHDAMPEGWLLLVKEHPTQFNQNPVFATPKGRARRDYEDLVKLRRVRLVSTDIPSSSLVRDSKATISITGTACWEAAINGVPGIHMAHTWYEGFPNTHFMPGFNDLKAFFDQIENYLPAPREQEHRYLEKFITSSFQFEIGEQEFPPGTFSSSQQAEGAVSAMRWWETTLK